MQTGRKYIINQQSNNSDLSLHDDHHNGIVRPTRSSTKITVVCAVRRKRREA